MKRRDHIVLCQGLSLALQASALAQTYEDIFEQFETAEAPELAEVLRQMVDQPIRINAVSGDSLARIWFLDVNQIEALQELHRRKAPHITNTDIAETLNIPDNLVAILFVDDQPVRWGYDFRSRYRQRHQGAQQDMRLRLHSEGLAAGIIIEKDAGERRFDDFLAGYVTARLAQDHVQVLAGDLPCRRLPVWSSPVPTATRHSPSATRPSVFRNRAFCHTAPRPKTSPSAAWPHACSGAGSPP